MEKKEREELAETVAETVAKTVNNINKLRDKANGYVRRDTCRATRDKLSGAISEMHADVKAQTSKIAKIDKQIGSHIQEHNVLERMEEKAEKKKVGRYKGGQFWLAVVIAAVSLIAAIATFAYAIGTMEERIMSRLDTNGATRAEEVTNGK